MTVKMCHIFRTGRPADLKLDIQIEYLHTDLHGDLQAESSG